MLQCKIIKYNLSNNLTYQKYQSVFSLLKLYLPIKEEVTEEKCQKVLWSFSSTEHQHFYFSAVKCSTGTSLRKIMYVCMQCMCILDIYV